jgi:hypothetical protein
MFEKQLEQAAKAAEAVKKVEAEVAPYVETAKMPRVLKLVGIACAAVFVVTIALCLFLR